MPTLVSQQPLDEVARLINEACEAGDNVSAIAERTGGVTRELVFSAQERDLRFVAFARQARVDS